MSTSNNNSMQIVNEKLEKNNLQTWTFRIINFLKEQGYWDFIEGANEKASKCPPRNATLEQIKMLKDGHQGVAKVVYWLSSM